MALTKILTSGLAANAATSAIVAAGAVVQIAQVTNTTSNVALASGMPYLSLPNKTQGTEFLSLAFTPKSASNRVLVVAQMMGSPSTADTMSLSVWRDSAYVTGSVATSNAGWPIPVIAILLDTPATASQVLYTARGGANTYGVYLNGAAAGRYSSAISSLTLIEVKA